MAAAAPAFVRWTQRAEEFEAAGLRLRVGAADVRIQRARFTGLALGFMAGATGAPRLEWARLECLRLEGVEASGSFQPPFHPPRSEPTRPVRV